MQGENTMKELVVKSSAFENKGLIPKEHTGYGGDRSPDFQLQNISEKAQSIAIIMDDIDHPLFPSYNHWIIWNVPIMNSIPGNIPPGKILAGKLSGAMQGRGYGKHKYRGPKPPFKWSHKYRFSVYTLDCILDLSNKSKKRRLHEAMNGHILQQATLVGHYR